MEKEKGMLLIIGACLLVLFLVTAKHKAEMLLNFCIRSVMGAIVIFGINMVMANWGIPCAVGLNLWSLLTSGTLGFSGVSLLYAVAAVRLL